MQSCSSLCTNMWTKDCNSLNFSSLCNSRCWKNYTVPYDFLLNSDDLARLNLISYPALPISMSLSISYICLLWSLVSQRRDNSIKINSIFIKCYSINQYLLLIRSTAEKNARDDRLSCLHQKNVLNFPSCKVCDAIQRYWAKWQPDCGILAQMEENITLPEVLMKSR